MTNLEKDARILDTLCSSDDEYININREIQKLDSIFTDLSDIVNDQQKSLDDIESSIEKTSVAVKSSEKTIIDTKEIEETRLYTLVGLALTVGTLLVIMLI